MSFCTIVSPLCVIFSVVPPCIIMLNGFHVCRTRNVMLLLVKLHNRKSFSWKAHLMLLFRPILGLFCSNVYIIFHSDFDACQVSQRFQMPMDPVLDGYF